MRSNAVLEPLEALDGRMRLNTGRRTLMKQGVVDKRWNAVMREGHKASDKNEWNTESKADDGSAGLERPARGDKPYGGDATREPALWSLIWQGTGSRDVPRSVVVEKVKWMEWKQSLS